MQATITEFQTVPNPERHELGGFRFVIKKDGVAVKQIDSTVESPSVTTNVVVVPGSLYTATAQRLSSLGLPIGPVAQSASLGMNGPESFDAPLTVSIAL